MDSHITGLDDTDDKIDVEYTELMGHLDLGKRIKSQVPQNDHFFSFGWIQYIFSDFDSFTLFGNMVQGWDSMFIFNRICPISSIRRIH